MQLIHATRMIVWILLGVLAGGCERTSSANGQVFAAALTKYAARFTSRGAPVPATVTLEELVSLGLLDPQAAKAFHGVKVRFCSGTREDQPDEFLVEAWMPDGTVIALLGDGSVQTLSPGRYKELREAADRSRRPVPGWSPGEGVRSQPEGTRVPANPPTRP